MSRVLLRPLAVLLALVATACAQVGAPSATAPAKPRGLDRVMIAQEVRIGMTGEQPPLNMHNRAGELFGLEVALGRTLARQMGVRARFVAMPFAELLPALEAGEIDLVMSGMTITARRNRRFAFVGPYYVSGKSLLTRSATLASVKEPEDLDRREFRYAALGGSTSEEFVRDALPNATLVTVPRLQRGIEMVVKGEVDALIADRETCAFAVLRNPDADLIALRRPLTVEPIGIALAPGQPLLQNLLENYLDALERTGRLQEARTYWFEDPSWVRDLP